MVEHCYVRWSGDQILHTEVIQQYRSYVKNKYGICTIVFDGYGYRPSTKDDHEHQRRTKTSKKSPKITIVESNTAYDRPLAFFVKRIKQGTICRFANILLRFVNILLLMVIELRKVMEMLIPSLCPLLLMLLV